MSSAPRYLTKSRFKQALECPTKLYYTGKPEYLNNSLEDSFLAALAEGGYQVGALACLMFPGGVEVDGQGHAAQLLQTQELLQREDVTIYEAALEAQGLFVRVDILRKRGRVIELIEVKAKSYDPREDGDFRGSKGEIKSGFLPYLQDIAFQRHVAGLALPGFDFRCFLMLADKSVVATVDGLNQRFRVKRQGRRVAIELAPGTAGSLGAPILMPVPVDTQIAEIVSGTVSLAGVPTPFSEAVTQLASAYREDRRIDPKPGTACGDCEFKAAHPPADGELRSGFHECWKSVFGWSDSGFAHGTILDLWNCRRKAALFERGALTPRAVTQEDLGFDGEEPGLQGMSHKHRQWYQCQPEWPGGGDFFFDAASMAREMSRWRYPLHFIDFETCAVAIPFSRGQRPYEIVAFQFSHHVMHASGRVEHRSQFLEATPGADPSIPFLRALSQALGGDDGTVFRWAMHENTVLNQLRRQLLAHPAPPPDRDALVTFVESITQRDADDGKTKIYGSRDMVDLCKLAERCFFHPSTRGSSSLKKVLPALMRCSEFLRTMYGQPLYGSSDMPSLNLSEPVAWWQQVRGEVLDPYDLLPPVFSDFTKNEVAAVEVSLGSELQEGGAAMAAYGRLQFEQIGARERQCIEKALMRYCELDTLATVMAVQAWQAWTHRMTTA